MASLQNMFKGKAMGSIIMLFLILFGAFYLISYLSSKGSVGAEMMSQEMNQAYADSSAGAVESGVQPAQPLGQNEVFAGANGAQTSIPTPSSSCSTANIQNPEELLPKSGGNDQFAQLNPSGQGELANVNLLKAGYHIGIDTIGQSLRNSNQQIRSEPANPQLYVGPWNNSTIEPDFMRPPLEIGASASQ